VKFTVLGVPEGPVVTEACARTMAAGVARLLDADIAVAVTGVGGPGPEEGQPMGTVWFAVAAGDDVRSERQLLGGEPDDVLSATTRRALELTRDALHRRAAIPS
jgi:nicotinamide-nucleotide amidase